MAGHLYFRLLPLPLAAWQASSSQAHGTREHPKPIAGGTPSGHASLPSVADEIWRPNKMNKGPEDLVI